MKILISRAELIDALSACSYLAGKNRVLQVLSNVRISAKSGIVTFESTSVEFSIRKHKSAIESDDCAFLIDCASLLKYVKLVKSDTIRITLKDNVAFIEHSDGKLKMPILPIATFPESQFNIKGEYQTITIPAGGFLSRALSDAPLFVGHDDFHPAMKALRIFSNEKYVGYSATDSRKLVHYQHEIFPSTPSEILISQDTFPLLAPVSPQDCTVQISDNCIVFDFGDTQVAQSKLTYKYADVTRVIPKDNNTKVEVNRKDLLSAVRRVSSLVNDSIAVRIDINYDSIKLRAVDIDMQKDISEAIPCKSTANITAAVSGAYLIDILNAIPDNEIAMHFASEPSARPIMLSGESCPDKTVLIMPMSVPNEK